MGDNGQWDADLFRREGHRMVEWIADYLDGAAREMPVLAQVEPGEIARTDSQPPCPNRPRTPKRSGRISKTSSFPA